MSRYLPLTLIASVGFAFSACQPDPVPEKVNRYPGTVGNRLPSNPEPESTPEPQTEVSHDGGSNVPKVEVETAPTPIPTPAVQDYPTAVAVEGKPGFVKSLNGSGIVDVRGYPPGTEVTDPYSGKVFLVP